MDFDYSVTTEQRFALRTWLEQLVEAINSNDRERCADFFDPYLLVEGFNEQPLNKEQYLTWLEERKNDKTVHVMRLPQLKIKLKGKLYRLNGTYEEFIDGILSYEGTMEMIVTSADDGFKLASMIFFPRLRVAPNENNETAELQN
ncbi:MAG: hypothetical protein V4736_07380 [Bdellovibrionota bacterium]